MPHFEPRRVATPSLQGFTQGMRQPAQIISLSLPEWPSAVPWARVDAWLNAWLDDPLDEPLHIKTWQKSGTQDSNAARLAWRIAVAAAKLLRVCGIPFLDPGRVLNIVAVTDKKSVNNAWRCELAIPRVEGVSTDIIRLTYETCAAWLLQVATAASPEDLLSRFYQQLETQTLPPLLAASKLSSSAMVLLRAAHQQQIPWSYEGQGICQLGWGKKSLRFLNTSIASDSTLGIEAAGDKHIAARWLRQAGLPASEHHLISNAEQAIQAAHRLGWPVVIKPADCERGQGVSVDLDTETKVLEAFKQARGLSARVLVERQAPGDCHRVLVVRAEVIYVVKRLAVAVQGDGRHTVAELIATNMADWRKRAPWHRPPPLLGDELAQQCLDRVGLALDAVPTKGIWAPLRRIESTADGGRDEDRMAAIHPDNKALAIRAAALFALDIAGIDIISSDISVPWHINGAIINEINASPAMGAGLSSTAAMPAVMTCLMSAQGRIPIEAFVGGDAALERAQQRQQTLVSEGLACYLTSHQRTQDNAGNPQPMIGEDLFSRCRALLMDRSVDAVLLVIHNDALLHTGLPVDRIDAFEHLDNQVAGDLEGLLELLRNHRPGNTLRNSSIC
ncbi:MAG: cyanophycin synthetase [Motiliproteus sp.]|jgi:cyanophycin synthetase